MSDTRFDFFESRTTSNAGIGLFATQDISAGTRLFHESPVIRLSIDADVFHLYTALNSLSESQRFAFRGLSFHDCGAVDFDYLRASGIDFDCDELEVSWWIYLTNRFNAGEGYLGLFLHAARLNHSCSPNLFHRFTERMSIHATRDIAQGEELFTSYIDICHPRPKRQQLLRYWGFLCQCSLCSSPDPISDERRARLETLISKGKKGRFNVPKLLDLMQEEKIDESDTTGLVYAWAAQKDPLKWLPRKLEVDERCMGIDSVECIQTRQELRELQAKDLNS